MSTGERKSKPADEAQPEIKVEDRRHWARDRSKDNDDELQVPDTRPTIIDEYRQRAEQAEIQLQEYIAAFKKVKNEQEQFRARLQNDIDRRVELQFGGLVEELLEGLDELDLALSHVADVPEARSLATGVKLVRDRFLATLMKHGVERIDPVGETFDPNLAEAIGMEPVEDESMDGRVTTTYRAGYVLGDRVLRPARVAVGKKP